MAAEVVFVRKDDEGSMPIIFPQDSTLEFVARRFYHDCSSGSIEVKTTAGGLFMALPLNTMLHQLGKWHKLKGTGSETEPYIVRVEQTVGVLDASMVAIRTKTAARYQGFVLGRDGKPKAVTVLTSCHVITYAHGEHDDWHQDDVVKVFVNDPHGDKPVQVRAVVVGKYPKVDVVILQVEGRLLEAPALDCDTPRGEPYVMLGYSSTGPRLQQPGPQDHASATHGSISTSIPDKHGRIRGDTPSSPGDSGGGIFSLQTGKLIAMNVGREKIPSSQGGEQPGYKSLLLPVAAVLALMSE